MHSRGVEITTPKSSWTILDAMRVLIAAEAFGFGPSSKLCSIAHELRARWEVDFFTNEHLTAARFPEFKALAPKHTSTAQLSEFDAALVCLSPTAAQLCLGQGLPVYYVDSLGFMWSKAFFATEFPESHRCRAYFCQDIFGAADTIFANAPQTKVKKVGAIVPRFSIQTNSMPRLPLVMQLGGLINPFNECAAREYLMLVGPILDEIQKLIPGTVRGRFDRRA
jgi:hypothetical protein